MHHSSAPDPELADRLGLGATGEFPEGQLTEQDEGELKFAVGYTEGKVVIDFGTPVSWVGMHPNQAKEFARLILKHANPITR